jgi:ataxia telangiectasia mutated family protein
LIDSNRDSLGDAGFQRIFESLFSIIRTEKSKHVKAATPTAKNSAELKLSQSSAAFRVVADAAATRIKHKTAIVVLDHVVDTLAVQGGGLFAPLRSNYMKSFRGLLQNPSLREHLKPKEWEGLIDFIVEALNFRTAEEDSQSNSGNSRDASIDARGESRMSIRVSQVSRGRTSRPEISNHVEELVVSLKLLTGTSNPATKFQEPALETLNNVFPSVLANDTTLARSATHQFIPVLRRMWSTRIGSLKDQLLIFLMNAKDLFWPSKAKEPSLLETTLLNDLLYTISHDYERRQERDCLQMDDVYFADVTELSPLRTLTLAPVRDSTRALTNWTCVAVLATLVSTLDIRHVNATGRKDADAAPTKRRKIESPLEGLVRQAITSSPQERLYATQTLLFAMEDSEATTTYLAQHLVELATGLSSDDDPIANWSMLLISRYEYAMCNTTFDLSDADLPLPTIQTCLVSESSGNSPAV